MSGYDYIRTVNLGQGGMGQVYKATKYSRDDRVTEEVALKISLQNQLVSMSEIDVLFRVNNPDLIKGWHLLNSNDRQFQEVIKPPKPITYEKLNVSPDSIIFDEELVSGSMNKLLEKGEITAFDEIFERVLTNAQREQLTFKLIYQVCSGLLCLERAGYIHIDLKPDNILYSLDSRKSIPDSINFYVGDYGILKNVDDDERMYKYTGTLIFFPPEYTSSQVIVTNTVPIWQLGLSLVSILGDKQWMRLLERGITPRHYRDMSEYVREQSSNINDTISHLISFIDKLPYSHNLQSMLKPMFIRDPLRRVSPERILSDLRKQPQSCNYHITKTLRYDSDIISTIANLIDPIEIRHSYYFCYLLILCRYYTSTKNIYGVDPDMVAVACKYIAAYLYNQGYDTRQYRARDIKEVIADVVRTLDGKLFDFDYIKKILPSERTQLLQLLNKQVYIPTIIHNRLKKFLQNYEMGEFDLELIRNTNFEVVQDTNFEFARDTGFEVIPKVSDPIDIRRWVSEDSSESNQSQKILRLQRDSYGRNPLDINVSEQLLELEKEVYGEANSVDDELGEMLANDSAFKSWR